LLRHLHTKEKWKLKYGNYDESTNQIRSSLFAITNTSVIGLEFHKMKYAEYVFLFRSDLHRYAGNIALSSFLYYMILEPGFKYSFWMRTCTYLKSHPISQFLFFPYAWLILHHYESKYGISISYRTQIGSGFYIGHFGGIVVNQNTIIGKNCNISQQVTLGVANRGERKGYPVIGDNVYIGPGAKVIGKVHVGNNVAIGANCVVTKDVPDNGVVVGVPGKVISLEGSTGYINKTEYDLSLTHNK
jgi:serine O-acetyltransferase